MEELKRMPISDLETIIGSVDFTKKECDWIWPVKRTAFEVY